MSREEIRNLIGGYATGNLTEAERRALFAAVMEDQELFDALAREQPLADLLADPAARARLLSALGEPEVTWRAGLWGWMRRPAVAALAASAAVAVVALVLVWAPRGERREEAKPVQVAVARKEAPPPVAAAPAPEPAPQPKPRGKPKPAVKVKRADVRLEPPPVVALAPPEREVRLREEVRVMAQAPAAVAEAMPATAADSAATGAAFRPRGPVMARSSYRAESGVLRATVVRLSADGGYEPVEKDASVAVTDAVRLRVETAKAGYLRVVQRESQQGWRPIFSGQAEAGRTYLVPAEGNLRLERGRREFVVLLMPAQGVAAQVNEAVVVEVK